MKFLTKRFVPSEKKIPDAKPIAARHDPANCLFDSRFVSVYRQLKTSENPQKKAESPQEPNSDWLASLGVATTSVLESKSIQTEKKIHSAFAPFWRVTLTSEQKAELKEKREFVKADCRQQKTAANRKLKARRGTQ